MTIFLTIADQTFDGAEYLMLTTSFGQQWVYYPEGRASPSEVWANFQSVIGLGYYTEFWLNMDGTKKLNLTSFQPSGSYTLMFKDESGGNSATVAAKFGFTSGSITASAGATITATNPVTAHEVTHLDPKFVDSSASENGHGSGAQSPARRDFDLTAVCTRAVASAIVLDIEQNGFIGVMDTESGGTMWTLRIKNITLSSVGSTKAQIRIRGLGRV